MFLSMSCIGLDCLTCLRVAVITASTSAVRNNMPFGDIGVQRTISCCNVISSVISWLRRAVMLL